MPNSRRLHQAFQNEVDAGAAVAPVPEFQGPDDAVPSDVLMAFDSPNPVETGAPANITIVRLVLDLQRATATGAVDIEIRAHLDLRGLSRTLNPAIPGPETFQNPKRNALLYAQSPLRSIRVRCDRRAGRKQNACIHARASPRAARPLANSARMPTAVSRKRDNQQCRQSCTGRSYCHGHPTSPHLMKI